MDLLDSIGVSSSGMSAQSLRMKIISENIANADSVMNEEGTGPYRRKTLHFQAMVDEKTGLVKVEAGKPSKDYNTPFREEYDPNNALADANGIVQYPNVNSLIESIDMREAGRLYEANMSAIEAAKVMMVRSLDVLR